MLYWRRDLETGLQDIDAQHKGLFQRVNRVLDACKLGLGTSEIKRVLDYLRQDLSQHFAKEEELLAEYNDPNHLLHKQQHDSLMYALAQLEKQLQVDGVSFRFCIAANQVLGSWLNQHIQQFDQVMADRIKAAPKTQAHAGR